MRLLTFLAGVATGVLLQQSRTAPRMKPVPPERDAIDDTDTVQPQAGVDVSMIDSPVIAGVGVPGDGVRS
jgi:hypothetical protein